MRRTDSASRMVSSAPIWVVLLLDEVERDLHRLPAVGEFDLALQKRAAPFERLAAAALRAAISAENTSRAVRPSSSPRGRPRKRSTDALTSTTRESRVNSIRPSCRLAMNWSTLSFSAEKISLASRIWRPRLAIFKLTSPYSS